MKGYCRTNSSIVYTTSNGIKKVPLQYSSLTSPSDYDYFYAYRDTSLCPSNQLCDWSNVYRFFDFNYSNNTVDSTSYVLLDTVALVACYDGTLATLETPQTYMNRGLQNIDPYNLNHQDNGAPGTPPNLYSPIKPSLGIFWMNNWSLFFDSTSNTNASLAIGESYIFTYDENAAANLTLYGSGDFSNSFGFLTMAFNPDGSFLGCSVRGNYVLSNYASGVNNNPLVWNDAFNKVERLDNSITYKMSGIFANYFIYFSDTLPEDAPADRIITNFTRIIGDDYTTILPIQIINGPACGLTVYNVTVFNQFLPQVQAAYECLPNNVTMFIKKIARS